MPESDHFDQTDPHDGCLGVVSPLQARDESGGYGDDVFESAGQGNGGDVRDEPDVEVGTVEEGFEGCVVERWVVGGDWLHFWFLVGGRVPFC